MFLAFWLPHLGPPAPSIAPPASRPRTTLRPGLLPPGLAPAHRHRAQYRDAARGVKVTQTEKYSEADFLKNSGIPTLIDAQHPIAHNKITIMDGYLVLTGAFNFTRAAEEHNAENFLLINDPVLARRYIANWHAHEQHSELYEQAPRAVPRGKA